MTLRRLVLWSLLGALLVAAGATLAAAAGHPIDPTPRYLDPAPWWWQGPKGDRYLLVVAGRPHGEGGIQLPPDVRPVDPVGTSPSRMDNDAGRGNAAASKPSVSASLSAPGGASIANAAGSLTFSLRASSAPARPDPRDVRRELESAHRALGL